MIQPPLPPRCDCCGLQISNQPTEYCPRCEYPILASKEEDFLTWSIADLRLIESNGGASLTIPRVLKLYQSVAPALSNLQRTALYGGGETLTITELKHRHQARLEHLHRLQGVGAPLEENIPLEGRAIKAQSLPESLLQSPIGGEKTFDMEEGQLVSQLVVPPAPTSRRRLPAKRPLRPVLVQPMNVAGSRKQEVLSTNVPIPKPRHTARTAALRSFFIGSPISLMVLLGAFLILMAMLTFVLRPTDPAHHPDPWLAFLVVLGTQIFFGAAGIGTQRLSKFINVARIYTFVFVLLIPLLGLEGYLLLQRQTLHIELSAVVVIVAVYAAIAYGAFAVYQRFSPFGYLGMMALVAADLAAVTALHLGIEWYPTALMVLALPALLVVPYSFGNSTSSLAVLYKPVRICMLLLVACAVVMVPVIFYVFAPHYAYGLVPSSSGIRLARLSILLLLLLWGVLFVWLAKLSRKAVPAVPYLFLVGVLYLAHTLDFQLIGYAFILTCVAVLYHGVSRFSVRLQEPFGKLGLRLDQLALLLASLVPLISAPYVPFQLLHSALPKFLRFFPAHPDWITVCLLSVSLLLTISVILNRANLSRAGTNHGWPWLLLLSGLLLNWTYGVIILLLHSDLTWPFLALTLSLVAVAVIVRRRFGAFWANPLDVLALSETLLIAAVLGIKPYAGDSIGVLLLFFAALFYAVLLFQRRQPLLILPFLFALAALPFVHAELRLVIGICLPLVAIAVQHLIAAEPAFRISSGAGPKRQQLTVGKEWPLLWIGLVCAVVVSLQDVSTATSVLHTWLGVALPSGVEIALFAVVLYLAAALTGRKWLGLPTTGFAVVALLFPPPPFWILVGITTGTAWLAMAISRLFGRDWAAPLYSTALLAAVLTAFTGYTQQQLPAAVWVLYALALLAYIIGMAEDLSLVLWLTPLFSLWSLLDSLILLDYYRAPTVALLCTLIAVVIGLPRLSHFPLNRPDMGHRLRRYALPFYTTAILAAVLTGLSGMFIGSSELLHQYNSLVLLAFAGIGYGVLLYEYRPKDLWLATGFAVWGMILMPPVNMLSLGIGLAIVGLIMGRFLKRATTASIVYALPFYVTALVAAVLTGIYGLSTPFASAAEYGLLVFSLLGVAIMLVEQRPEILLVPAALATWAIWLTHWDVPQEMIAYSLLCVLIFASQFVWKLFTAVTDRLSAIILPRVLGLGGQVLVVLAIVVQATLPGSSPEFAHVEAGALGVLALLLVWSGYAQPVTSVRHWCNYGAGLILALVVSWELIAFGQTKLDILLLTPASYLSVIAPFLMRDRTLKEPERVGQFVAVIGAALLLLPTGILSIIGNRQDDLISTLLLLGEALSLFFLGIATRVRFFILGGAGLVIVGTVRALFLPPSFIPIWVVLVVSGGALLIGATLLTLRMREDRVMEAE